MMVATTAAARIIAAHAAGGGAGEGSLRRAPLLERVLVAKEDAARAPLMWKQHASISACESSGYSRSPCHHSVNGARRCPQGLQRSARQVHCRNGARLSKSLDLARIVPSSACFVLFFEKIRWLKLSLSGFCLNHSVAICH